MTKWRKRQDLGSRRAIQRGIRELLQIGYISSPVLDTYYEPIKYFGPSSRAKRIAMIILRDGTKLVEVVLGPSSDCDSSWFCWWVDLFPQAGLKQNPSFAGNKIIKLERVLGSPVVWAPREIERNETILDFWGYDLAKWRQDTIRKRIGNL